MEDLYKKVAQEFINESDLIFKAAAWDILESMKGSFKDYVSDVKDNFKELVENPTSFLRKTYQPGSYSNLRSNYNKNVLQAVNNLSDVNDLKTNISFGLDKSWASER